MATKAQETKKQSAIAERRAGKRAERLVWVIFVGIVPVIVAALVIAVAMQVMGVPVWQSALRTVGIHTSASANTSANTTSSAAEQANQAYEAAQKQIANLRETNQALQNQMQSSQTQIQSLKSQIAKLQKQVKSENNDIQSGQQEAKVLTQMDPAAAALVLQKMGLAKAAWVVAEMDADTSGAILQETPTAFASQVLQQASKDQQLAAQAATNTTNGTTD